VPLGVVEKVERAQVCQLPAHEGRLNHHEIAF
jgi:hypothetical protein